MPQWLAFRKKVGTDDQIPTLIESGVEDSQLGRRSLLVMGHRGLRVVGGGLRILGLCTLAVVQGKVVRVKFTAIKPE